MRYRESGGLLLGEFAALAKVEGLVHCVSTRVGGVSPPPFSSLNLGLHVADEPDCVLENRRRLCAALDVDQESLIVPLQVHGGHVAVVGMGERGRGAFDLGSAVPDTDGLVTDERGLMLMAFSSDCPLILLLDPARPAIGLIHAGWRGTVARIAERAVETMAGSLDSDPSDLVACICPSIGPCCFEVKDDVIEAAGQGGLPVDRLVERRDGKTCFNLWRANEEQLVSSGLRRENVLPSETCTACRTDLFFSHRRERGQSGRFAALIMLAP